MSKVDFEKGEIWLDQTFWRKQPEISRETSARRMAVLRDEKTGLGVQMVIRASGSGEPLTVVHGNSVVIHTN